MRILHFFVLIPRNIAIAILLMYRKVISPLYGEVCRYYPSCSRYALEAYQQRSVIVATALTAWRLLRCNPWSAGGVDDVPPPKRPHTQKTARGFVIPAS